MNGTRSGSETFPPASNRNVLPELVIRFLMAQGFELLFRVTARSRRPISSAGEAFIARQSRNSMLTVGDFSPRSSWEM